MTHRERVRAILHGENYDRMPVVAFGYWDETLEKWADEGHITREECDGYKRYGDNSDADFSIMKRLGFDFNWNACFGGRNFMHPYFEEEILETKRDGSIIKRDNMGLHVLVKPGIVSIPAEIGTSMEDRDDWEALYKHRFQYSDDRIDGDAIRRALSENETRELPLALHCGSLYGNIRNMMGVEGLSYLHADDEELYIEIIDTVGELVYKVAEKIASSGIQFEYAHFWEDICFNSGPLVHPDTFREYVAPHYKRITDMLRAHGIDRVSVDCDGKIDKLVPIWLENGVNTMFPIEVGTWRASIAPWREQYGEGLFGVGGMDKRVFAHDKAAVDAEIERLKPLVDLGGYIPCPDHRIAPDAKFELVQYYCEQFLKTMR
ncbi:MAG: uroporphyrinogen decarboxylase family protein [Christensenellales bacterium]